MTMEDTDDFGRMDDNEDGLSDLTYPEPPNHHAFNPGLQLLCAMLGRRLRTSPDACDTSEL